MKSKIKNLSAFKKLTLLATVIILIFALINAVWLIRFGIPYYGYVHSEGFSLDEMTAEIDDFETPKQYKKETDGYVFRIRNCHYLGKDCFLKVSKPVERRAGNYDGDVQQTNQKSYLLFIWPDTFKGYAYGVLVDDAGTGEYQTIPIDANLKVTFDYADEAEKKHDQKVIDNNYDEIKSLMELAQEEWGLQRWHDLKQGLKCFFSKLS